MLGRKFHIARDYGHAVYEEVEASSSGASKWFILVKKDGTVELTGGVVPPPEEGSLSTLYVRRVGGYNGPPNPELTLQAVLGN